MHADPQPAVLVGEEIHVVVAAADSPELVRGKVVQLPLRPKRRVPYPIEDRMVRAFALVAPDAKRDALSNLVHDGRYIDVVDAQIGQRRTVTALNVVADGA